MYLTNLESDEMARSMAMYLRAYCGNQYDCKSCIFRSETETVRVGSRHYDVDRCALFYNHPIDWEIE